MRKMCVVVIVLGFVSTETHAQTPAPGTGFTAQELDRMSQQNLDAGAHRGFAGGRPPPPAGSIHSQPLHSPPGIWVCKSTEPNVAILAAPSASAAPVARSNGQVAAGADTGDYTSILLRENRIGYVQRSSVHPYVNQFNPRVSCVVAGLRPDGMVQFGLR